MDRAAGNEHTIITDRQVWALMGLMDGKAAAYDMDAPFFALILPLYIA